MDDQLHRHQHEDTGMSEDYQTSYDSDEFCRVANFSDEASVRDERDISPPRLAKSDTLQINQNY